MSKLSGPNDGSTKALRKLEAQGLAFTNEAFVREFAFGGNLQNVRLFIEAGIDVNATIDGTPPIVSFASFHRGDCEIARLLIDKGADVNAVSEDGVTAIQMALFHKRKDLVKLLIENGADANSEPVPSGTAITRREITNIVERLELLEEKFGVAISGLYATCTYVPNWTPPYHKVMINFDVTSLGSGQLQDNLSICASAYNSAGQLLKTEETYLLSEKFVGFKSMSIGVELDQVPAKIRLSPAAM